MSKSKIDWDEYERKEQERLFKSFSALGTDALKAAVESIAHWNRMYRELLAEQNRLPEKYTYQNFLKRKKVQD